MSADRALARSKRPAGELVEEALAPRAPHRYRPADAVMDRFSLSFADPTLETAYRVYAETVSLRLTTIALSIFLIVLAVFGISEWGAGYTGAVAAHMGVARGLTGVVTVLALAPGCWPQHLSESVELREARMVVLYIAIGAVVIATEIIGVWGGQPLYYPFTWWMTAWDLVWITTLLSSGMRFALASVITFMYPLSVCLAYIPAPRPMHPSETEALVLELAVAVGGIVVAYRQEAFRRAAFFRIVNLLADTAMHEDVYNQMLPKVIREEIEKARQPSADARAFRRRPRASRWRSPRISSESMSSPVASSGSVGVELPAAGPKAVAFKKRGSILSARSESMDAETWAAFAAEGRLPIARSTDSYRVAAAPAEWKAMAWVYPSATVMFVHVANMTRLSARASSPLDVVTFLNKLYSEFDAIVASHRPAYKVMAIAKMYLVVAGAPEPTDDHATIMAAIALDIMRLVKRKCSQMRVGPTRAIFKVGLHSGEVAAGVIGISSLNWHIFGDTVNVASRMCSENEPGRIQVSHTTAALLEMGSNRLDTTLTCRGRSSFKGKGEMTTFFLTDAKLELFASAESAWIDSERVALDALRSKKLQGVVAVRASPRSTSSSVLGSIKTILGMHDSHHRSSSPVRVGEGLPSVLDPDSNADHSLDLSASLPGAPLSRSNSGRSDVASRAARAFAVGGNRSGGGTPDGSARALALRKSWYVDPSPAPASPRPLYQHQDSCIGDLSEDTMLPLADPVTPRPQLEPAKAPNWAHPVEDERMHPLLLTYLEPAVEEAFAASESKGLLGKLALICALATACSLTVLVVPFMRASVAGEPLPGLTTIDAGKIVFVCFAALASGLLFASLSARVRTLIGQSWHERTIFALAIIVTLVVVRDDVNVAFALLISFSYLPARAYIIAAINASSFVIIAVTKGLTISVPWLVATHLAVVAAASAISTSLAISRERARRDRFNVMRKAVAQAQGFQAMLERMLPTASHAARLVEGETLVELLDDVTLLYSDISGFTKFAGTLSAHDLIDFLDSLFFAFDEALHPLGVYKIETIGDAFIVVGGLAGVEAADAAEATPRPAPRRTARVRPDPAEAAGPPPIPAEPLWVFPEDALPVTSPERRASISHVGRSALFAVQMLDILRDQCAYTGIMVKMRIGIHTGRAVGGIIGRTRPRYFVWGSDCDIAEQMEASGEPMEVHVSWVAAQRLAKEGFVLVPSATVTVGAPETHDEADASFDDVDSSSHAMLSYVLVGLDRVSFAGQVHSFDLRAARAVATAGSSAMSALTTPRIVRWNSLPAEARLHRQHSVSPR